MKLTSDIELSHQNWERADTDLCNRDSIGLFARLIDLFLIACAIGIMEDKSINDIPEELILERPKSIGRSTYSSLQNPDLYDCLDFLLQNALLNSKTINIDDEERLKLAFDPDYNNKKISASTFLVGFANYGLGKIYEKIDSKSSIIAIEELYEYFDSLTLNTYDDLIASLNLDDYKGLIN